MTKKKVIAMLTFSATSSISKNKQIKIYKGLIPNYVNIRIPNTSTAVKYTNKKAY
jgi:hypothetical protein